MPVQFSVSRITCDPNNKPTMDLRILIFFTCLAFNGAPARSTSSSDSKDRQSSEPVTSNSKPRLWPNGIIPYEISPYFSQYSRQNIMNAIHHIHDKSCVRFVERTNEDVYTTIQLGNDCSATIGYMNESKVILEAGCTIEMGLIQHELMHVMGFNHEHTRRDRDQYIAIFEENIEPDQLRNFEKDENGYYDTFELPYDYQSVLHYPSGLFAVSHWFPTMIAKDNKYRKLGQNEKLSPIDIQKINAMYPCKSTPPMRNEYYIINDDNDHLRGGTYFFTDLTKKNFG